MRSLLKNKSGITTFIIVFVICLVGYFFILHVVMPATVDTEQVNLEIFKMINEERADHGLAELNIDNNLESIAKEWSDELIQIGELTHGNFGQRIASIGYSNYSCSEIIAEQNGWTLSFARDFVDGWIDFPAHYDIMMTESYGYMGIGVSKDGSMFYAVADFRFE